MIISDVELAYAVLVFMYTLTGALTFISFRALYQYAKYGGG